MKIKIAGCFIVFLIFLVHADIMHAAVIQDGVINEDFSDLKILEEWSPPDNGGKFTTDGKVATLDITKGWTWTGADHGIAKMIDTTKYTGLLINVVSMNPGTDIEVSLPTSNTLMPKGHITAPGEYYLPFPKKIVGTNPVGQIFLVAHGNGSIKIDSLKSVIKTTEIENVPAGNKISGSGKGINLAIVYSSTEGHTNDRLKWWDGLLSGINFKGQADKYESSGFFELMEKIYNYKVIYFEPMVDQRDEKNIQMEYYRNDILEWLKEGNILFFSSTIGTNVGIINEMGTDFAIGEEPCTTYYNYLKVSKSDSPFTKGLFYFQKNWAHISKWDDSYKVLLRCDEGKAVILEKPVGSGYLISTVGWADGIEELVLNTLGHAFQGVGLPDKKVAAPKEVAIEVKPIETYEVLNRQIEQKDFPVGMDVHWDAFVPPEKEEWEKKYFPLAAKHLASMKTYGINSIRGSEFAWHFIEPEEGKFDFTFTDWLINECMKNNITISAILSTHVVPPWLLEKSKNEILHYTREGIPYERPEIWANYYCWHSPTYIRYTERYIRKVVERYKDNPVIIAYQLGNETRYNLPDGRLGGDFNPYTLEAFRRYMEKYKGIKVASDALSYSITEKYIDEWVEFNNTSIAAFIKWQADIVRSIDSRIRLSHNVFNINSKSNLIDYVYRFVDTPGVDVYPARKQWRQVADEVDTQIQAAQGKPAWIMETNLFQLDGGNIPTPLDLKRSVWTSIGAGTKGIYWYAWWMWSVSETGEVKKEAVDSLAAYGNLGKGVQKIKNILIDSRRNKMLELKIRTDSDSLCTFVQENRIDNTLVVILINDKEMTPASVDLMPLSKNYKSIFELENLLDIREVPKDGKFQVNTVSVFILTNRDLGELN